MDFLKQYNPSISLIDCCVGMPCLIANSGVCKSSGNDVAKTVLCSDHCGMSKCNSGMLCKKQGCSTGNSRSLPPIWLQTFPSREFPELREFPVLRESREFPSHGKFPFLSAHISDFQSVFCIRKLVLWSFQLCT